MAPAVAGLVFAAALISVSGAPSSPPASPIDPGTEALYRKLFGLVDLTKSYMVPVKQKVEAGDWTGAMLAYRAILAERCSKLGRVGRPAYSLWQPAIADELLKGDATTARYGDTSVHYTGHIGRPGEINWFASHPEYRDYPRDISNLHWINKLTEAYVQTKDPKYLVAWWTTMADFAERWPAQWAAARKDPVIKKTPGLGWITGPLMTGMRLYAIEMGLLGCLQTAAVAGHLEQVDPRALALVLVRVASNEMGYALPTLKWAGGNQVRIVSSEVLNWGLLLPEMKDAAKWRLAAVPANIGTCLLDGSDQEQSLNYFNNGIAPLVNLLRKRLPPEEQDSALLAKLDTMNAYRGRVLPVLARPCGFPPGTGTDPVWNVYGQTRRLTPPSTAFTSVVLPYGGYAVQRGGWNPDSLYLFMKQSRPSYGHWRPMDGCLQMSAYGRDLLVSPNGQVYDKRESLGGWHACWNTHATQNGVAVDGLSSAEKKGDPKKGVFENLDPWRWHTSARYDFMETVVAGPYRGGDFRTSRVPQPKLAPGQPPPAQITDVIHRRQVHFLREAKCWVVTDRLHSAAAHDFTQGWSLGPEFAEQDVDVNYSGKSIRTVQAKGPNLSLYQFGIADLNYARYFGVRDDKQILGWVGIMADKEKWLYTPAVNIHANWRSQGDRVLVTLMVPRPGAPERVHDLFDKSSAGVSGFDAALPDGRPVAYRAALDHAVLEANGLKSDASSLLVIRHPDGRLTGVVLGARMFNNQAVVQPDFEFDAPSLDQPPQITPISAPTGFRWTGNGRTLLPDYRSPAW